MTADEVVDVIEAMCWSGVPQQSPGAFAEMVYAFCLLLRGRMDKKDQEFWEGQYKIAKKSAERAHADRIAQESSRSN